MRSWEQGAIVGPESFLVSITLQSRRKLRVSVGQEPASAEVQGFPTLHPSLWSSGVLLSLFDPALLIWEPGLWGTGLVDPKTLSVLAHSGSSWLVPGGAGSLPGWDDRAAFTWVLTTFSQCPSGHTDHSWTPVLGMA